MKIVAGIDVSKGTLDVCADKESKSFANEAEGHRKLSAWLLRRKVDLAVMEATGSYHEELAAHLVERGIPVAVVNPARALYYARSLGKRNKTDRVDAVTLAQMGSAQPDLVRYAPPSDEQKTLTRLVRMRQDVVALASTVKVRKQEKGLLALESQMLAQQAEFFAMQIKGLEEEIRSTLKASPELSLHAENLRTIPGVGEVTAWSLLAEGADFTRFESPKQIAAYTGVCPSVKQSGTSLKTKGTMSRTGNAKLRKALYMAALGAVRSPGAFQDLYSRLVNKGKAKKAALGAVMHKLIRVAYALVKNRCPFNLEGALTSE